MEITYWRGKKLGELTELIIAWAALSFCFALRWSYNLYALMFFYLISALTLGLGFISHELGHRNVALKLGCKAEFRLWPIGLAFALILALLTHGNVVFAAPGAVHVTPLIISGILDEESTRKSLGIISLTGPLINYALALVFIFIKSLELGEILSLVGRIGFEVNAWLALFNMLPFPPLDGSKVFAWNKVVWGGFFGVLFVTMFAPLA